MFNFVKRQGLKFGFIILDDLWLYSFHNQEYSGEFLEVLKILSFIEENQWKIIGLEEWLNKVESTIDYPSEYNVHSDPKFLKIQRKNSSLLLNTLDFFIFSVPLTVLFVIGLNKAFYLLFEYEISKFLRPYSFWCILLELLIQSNTLLFSFFGFKSL